MIECTVSFYMRQRLLLYKEILNHRKEWKALMMQAKKNNIRDFLLFLQNLILLDFVKGNSKNTKYDYYFRFRQRTVSPEKLGSDSIMKSKFLISISFLLFLSCQFISELKHKDEIVSEAYVNNPNGLALYKIRGDLKSKEVVLNPEEKFYFLEKSNEDVKEGWRKVLYGGKELFAYVFSDCQSGIVEYSNLEKIENRFAVTERELYLKESPLKNTGDLKEVPAFSVVEILASYGRCSDQYLIKVKTQTGRVGFIERDLPNYETKELAEKNASALVSNTEGYFLLTSKEPVFLKIESMLPIDRKQYKEIMSKGKLFFVNYSKVIDGMRYYSFRSNYPLQYLEGESFILIPEYNGKFLDDKDFTDYTIENTKYKGDPSFIKIVRELPKEFPTKFLNFLDFRLTKLSTYSKSMNYYLATARGGMGEINKSYILREDKNSYSQVTVKDIYGIDEVKTFDLDEDGVLEILSRGWSRGDAYYQLFGIKNGNYRLIATFPLDSIIKKNIIYALEGLTEYLLTRNEFDEPNTKTYGEGTKLKYQKGKLIKIK